MLAEKSALFRTLISQYIQAKDNNKPHWIPLTFCEQAQLIMNVQTSAIHFPPNTTGCDAISQLLVKDFNRLYENVYTLCLNDTENSQDDNTLSCLWLVGMTDKETRNIKIGCGRYKWQFLSEKNRKASHLTVDLDQMEILPHLYTEGIFHWLSSLPYPWVDSDMILRGMPDIDGLEPIRQYLMSNTH